MKPTYKIVMVDGSVYSVSFSRALDDTDDESIDKVRTFLNTASPFLSVGNTIINLHHVKRVKKIRRFHFPKLSFRKAIAAILRQKETG